VPMGIKVTMGITVATGIAVANGRVEVADVVVVADVAVEDRSAAMVVREAVDVEPRVVLVPVSVV